MDEIDDDRPVINLHPERTLGRKPFMNPSPVQWKKGQSGNPGGRPRIPPDVIEAARALTPQAMQTLETVMTDKNVPASARVAAASAVLDRAWGKPTIQVEAKVQREIRQMSDNDLLLIIAEAKAEDASA